MTAAAILVIMDDADLPLIIKIEFWVVLSLIHKVLDEFKRLTKSTLPICVNLLAYYPSGLSLLFMAILNVFFY